jgi:hypothetical protein
MQGRAGPRDWPRALAAMRRLNVVAAALHAAVAACVLALALAGDTKFFMRLTRNRVVLDEAWAFGLANCTKDCFSVTAPPAAAPDELGGICVGGAAGRADCPAPGLPVGCEDSLAVVTGLFSRAVPVAQFQLVWLVVALQAVTAATHAYLGLAEQSGGMPDARWLAHMEANRQPLRWLEYSASAGLMTVVIASLGRITDVFTLLGLLGSTVLTMLCGYQLEREPAGRDKLLWWLGGAAAFGVTWAVILVNYVSFVSFFRDNATGTKNFKSLIAGIWPPSPAQPQDRGEFFSDIGLLLELAIFVPFALFLLFATLAATVACAQQASADGSQRQDARSDSRPKRAAAAPGAGRSCRRAWSACACCCCCSRRRAADSIERAAGVCAARAAREGPAAAAAMELMRLRDPARAGAPPDPERPAPGRLGAVQYALGAERSYVALSFCSKLALAALLAAGTTQAERDRCEAA